MMLLNLTRVRHHLSAEFGLRLEIGPISRYALVTRAKLRDGRTAQFSSGLFCGSRRVSEADLERQIAYQLTKAIQ